MRKVARLSHFRKIVRSMIKTLLTIKKERVTFREVINEKDFHSWFRTQVNKLE